MEIALRAIGTIRTPFAASTGTPIQSRYAQGAEGSVEIFDEYAAGLKDIEGFDRLWLIYLFDRAVEAQLEVRPYLDDARHGIFATRSPARPNQIGISSVRLLRVEGTRLTVADVDMLDGTPLIDIKPCVPEFDYLPVERIGWFEGRFSQNVVADDRFEQR
jgi:tRNA-Thr(GGU) m(6)t(6)A37 methyltransferase TsaA